jgi:hypothetical protein
MTVHGILRLGRARPTVFRLLLVVAAALAIPTAMFATSKPASANGTIICEASGNFCIGASNLSAGTPVTEVSGSSARLIIQELVSGTDEFTLVFNGNQSNCVTGESDDKVFVESCSSSGTVWIKEITSSSTYELKSRELGLYLSGHNNGTQFFLTTDGASGARQEFENGT